MSLLILLRQWRLILAALFLGSFAATGWLAHSRGQKLTVINHTWQGRLRAQKQAFDNAQLKAANAQQAEYQKLQDRYNAQYQIAVQNAGRREQTIKADAARTRAASDSLRSYVTRKNIELSGKEAAPAVYAIAASQLLENCAGRYTELAEKADGHVSDVRTLIDSK